MTPIKDSFSKLIDDCWDFYGSKLDAITIRLLANRIRREIKDQGVFDLQNALKNQIVEQAFKKVL